MPPDPKASAKARTALGKFLRDQRIRCLLSQDNLAMKAGLTKAQVIDMEYGRTNYTVDSLCAVLKALGVDLVKALNNSL